MTNSNLVTMQKDVASMKFDTDVWEIAKKEYDNFIPKNLIMLVNLTKASNKAAEMILIPKWGDCNH